MAQRPAYRRITRKDGTEDFVINRAGVEALITGKVDEMVAEGKTPDEIAEFVAEARRLIGLDR